MIFLFLIADVWHFLILIKEGKINFFLLFVLQFCGIVKFFFFIIDFFLNMRKNSFVGIISHSEGNILHDVTSRMHMRQIPVYMKLALVNKVRKKKIFCVKQEVKQMNILTE